MLSAIEGSGFDGVAVLVTRYYGGTQLGAGGLVRAYGGAAAKSLEGAPGVLVYPKVDAIITVGQCTSCESS
jgi:putative IMPACT (imprinted ancient) family translation regulator